MLLLAASPSYGYDAFAPLDLSIDDATVTDRVRVTALSFRSQNDLIHATYIAPESPPTTMPAVLFAHAYDAHDPDGDATVLEDAKWLARRGIASLVPREPYRATDARDIVSSVIALRRGLDVLSTRAGVDKDRFGLVGADLGTPYGALLAGTDGRVRTAVFESLGPSLAKLAEFDVSSALSRTSLSSVLLQFAKHDPNISRANADGIAATISGANVTERFYDTDPALADEAATDERRVWLLAHLSARVKT